jgi:hypothetical protein
MKHDFLYFGSFATPQTLLELVFIVVCESGRWSTVSLAYDPCRCFENRRVNLVPRCSRESMASTQDTRNYTGSGRSPTSHARDYEYVFLKFKGSKRLTTRGMQARVLRICQGYDTPGISRHRLVSRSGWPMTHKLVQAQATVAQLSCVGLGHVLR